MTKSVTQSHTGASSLGRIILKMVLTLTTGLLLTLVCVSMAWATTFTVTNTDDSGPGSLRAAIEAANANAGDDEIVFADGVSGTITLASVLPPITDEAELAINGGGDVTVSGNHEVGVFEVRSSSIEATTKLTLRNLTIADGAGAVTTVGRQGGGINNDGTLEVVNVTFSGNQAESGGGIDNGLFSKLKVTNSTFSGNSAGDGGGGGIYNGSIYDFTVTNSTFSNNSASFGGGGIYNSGGGTSDAPTTATVTNSTFSGNSAVGGGGIYNRSGPLEVTNNTFSNNSASNSGGGIYHVSTVDMVKVTNSTFSGNSADEGSGIYNNGSPTRVTLSNTILANSPSGGNCLGFPVTDGGYNIDSGTSCGFTAASGSLSNTNPLLDPAGLQDNGGRTQTIALQPDSPAVDLVGQGACPPPTTDQRGIERPQGAACDSGAFELAQDTTPPTVITTVPKANANEVAPTANVRATFSEDMQPASVKNAFKLFKKGSTTQIAAQVSYDAATDKATLNPNNNLQRDVTYRAVVTTVAKDVAGNRLDQDDSTTGSQQKVWYFTVD